MQYTIFFSSNFNIGSERLSQGTGQTLKDNTIAVTGYFGYLLYTLSYFVQECDAASSWAIPLLTESLIASILSWSNRNTIVSLVEIMHCFCRSALYNDVHMYLPKPTTLPAGPASPRTAVHKAVLIWSFLVQFSARMRYTPPFFIYSMVEFQSRHLYSRNN